ncbi:hypothetical protein KAR91_24895 [Candidatus Pacearchaeota archaeon]|nr:hypothetical protein [Candidatus Pacearchaeota archaeon]
MENEGLKGESNITVAEARREVQKLKKKSIENNQAIAKYSAITVAQDSYFNSIREQKTQLQILLHETTVLNERVRLLSERIDYTNMVTEVDFDGKPMRLKSLLYLLHQQFPALLKTQEALGKKRGKIKKRLYSERTKSQNIAELKDMIDEIPHVIDELNRHITLLDLPPVIKVSSE